MAIGRSLNLTSPQYARRRREQLIRQSIVAAVSVLLIVISIIVVTRLDIFQIQSVHIEGNSVTATGDIQAKVIELTTGKYLWFIPKTNVLFYPKQAILAAIKNTWFRIETVGVGLSGQWQGEPTLNVRVTERKPAYVWCGMAAPAVVLAGSGNEHCLYSDETGYLYAEAASFSGTPYVKLYGGLATGTPALGGHFLASSTPDAFGSALSFISAIGGVDFFGASFKPMALIAKESNEFEVVTAGGTRIFFTLDQDIQRLIENFRRVVNSENLTATPVDYLDLRYGNKVYYKNR